MKEGSAMTGCKTGRVVCFGVAALLSAGVAGALEPDETCQVMKNKGAGKYALCRQKAEAKLVKTAGMCSVPSDRECYRGDDCNVGATCDKDLVKYHDAIAKCTQRFGDGWQKAQEKGAGQCPTTDDKTPMQDFVTRNADGIARALAGGELPGFPATGQTTCWADPNVIDCTDTGQDGEVQAGATLSYVDNEDGTITDLNTGLMWEVLCDQDPDDANNLTCPEDQDVDTEYSWAEAFTKIADMNAALYKGYHDWRLPNYKELVSILDLEQSAPTVDSAFNNGACGTVNCTATECSCTASGDYWSSTTKAADVARKWAVSFDSGTVDSVGKGNSVYVRAVRGGL
jgi:hypothetical protein